MFVCVRVMYTCRSFSNGMRSWNCHWMFSPGIPTTIKTMGVNITTIAYLRVLIIEIGSTIILMVVEGQGFCEFEI